MSAGLYPGLKNTFNSQVTLKLLCIYSLIIKI